MDFNDSLFPSFMLLCGVRSYIYRILWTLHKVFESIISSQHFAHGDAWHLPVGAHETMSHLKDAGGHSSHVFSPIL